MVSVENAAKIRELMKQPESAERNALINALARGYTSGQTYTENQSGKTVSITVPKTVNAEKVAPKTYEERKQEVYEPYAGKIAPQQADGVPVKVEEDKPVAQPSKKMPYLLPVKPPEKQPDFFKTTIPGKTEKNFYARLAWPQLLETGWETKTTPPSMTLSQYRQGLTNQYQYMEQQQHMVRGSLNLRIHNIAYLRDSEQAQRNILKELERIKGFDPDTKVGKTEQGFEYIFPYAGAENYSEYKKQTDMPPANASFGEIFSYAMGKKVQGMTSVDPFSSRSVYNLVAYGGAKNPKYIKAQTQLNVEAASYIKSKQSKGFMGNVEMILESPYTQVGLSYVGGTVIGKALGAGTAYLTVGGTPVKIAAAKTLQRGAFLIGAGVLGKEGFEIYQTAQTDPGKAFGRLVLTGGSIAAGYTGYKKGYVSSYENYIRTHPIPSYTQINMLDDKRFLWDTKMGKQTASGRGFVKQVGTEGDFKYGILGEVKGKQPFPVAGFGKGKQLYRIDNTPFGEQTIDILAGRNLMGKYISKGIKFTEPPGVVVDMSLTTGGNSFISRGGFFKDTRAFLSKGYGEISWFGDKEIIPRVSMPSGSGTPLKFVMKNIVDVSVKPFLITESPAPGFIATPVMASQESVNIPKSWMGVYDVPYTSTVDLWYMPRVEKSSNKPDVFISSMFPVVEKKRSGWSGIRTGSEYDQIKESMEKNINRQTPIIKPDVIDSSMFTQDTTNLNRQSNMTEQILRQSQVQMQKQIYEQVYQTDNVVIPKAIVNTVIIIPPFLLGLPQGGAKMEPLAPSGYDVFVKARRYYKGKKRKPESWTKINPYPLTREQALSLGGSAVEHSAAASFKLKATSGAAKPLDIKVESWGGLAGKFYEKKGVLIERTLHRINTGGEIKGISALGWLRSREMKPIPKRQMPQTKVRLAPNKSFIVNTDKLLDTDKLMKLSKVKKFKFRY